MVAQIDLDMLRHRPSMAIGRLVNYALLEGRPLTTRGQWINPLVFSMFKIAQLMPPLRSVERPVFIVGNGRSGTTFLGRLFALHQDVSFLNEPKALWHFAHGAEDLIGSYSGVAAAVRIEPEIDNDKARKKIQRVYGFSLAASGAKHIVDKYPELVFRTKYVCALFPDARFVCPIRDGVDVVNSVARWTSRNANFHKSDKHNWWGKNDRKWTALVDQLVPEHNDLAPHQAELRVTKSDFDRAAVEWMLTTREALKLDANPATQFRIFRYENICSDPENELRLLFDWLNIVDDLQVFKYAKSHTNPPPSNGNISLCSEIAEPFRETLHDAGYNESAGRVLISV